MLKAFLTVGIVGFAVMPGLAAAAGSPEKSERAKADPWKLAVQAWSFKKFTFYETIEKARQAGIGYIEMYPGQKISKEKPEIRTTPDMPAEIRKEVKAKLKEAGIRVINYGVIGLPEDEKKCRRIFEFARDMSIQTIVSEPPEDALELIDRLCGEYKIKVAIHNHPKPSHYWNPDTVLKALEGRSKMIGACADTGHWLRSGLDPVESLKKLQGRLISFHLKDLNQAGVMKAHDVPWGTGRTGIKDVLKEAARQKFKGVFTIEYEHNWDNSLPDIKKCVQYFKQTSKELLPVRCVEKDTDGPKHRQTESCRHHKKKEHKD